MSSSSCQTEKKMLTLKSSEGETFEIEEVVALQTSQTIKFMVDDGYADNAISLPNVTGITLAKVIEYWKQHAQTDNEEDNKAFDAEFVKVEKDVLFDLMLAANYLDSKGLLDLTCQTMADMIKDYTPEEVRKTFNIENDFTPEEEERIRKQNAWSFE